MLGRFLDDQTVVAALQVVSTPVAQNYKLKDGRAQNPAAGIPQGKHPPAAGMQPGAGRGARGANLGRETLCDAKSAKGLGP